VLTHGPVRVVADAAEWMLECGGDVSRVQAAAETLARSLGMREAECFALPTGVILTLVDGAGFTSTVVRRIGRRTVHLDRLAGLEAVIREAPEARWGLGEVWLRLKEASGRPGRPAPVLWAASGLAAGGFALFFGGSAGEGAAAAVLGLAWGALRTLVDRPALPPALVSAAGAFLMVGAARLVSAAVPMVQTEPVAVGGLMLLVPGLALVNALRDLVAGELVSSQARLAEVVLTGASVAVGASLALGLGTAP